ncbi:hypothetical protein L4Y34_004284, partial [Pseudomonas aeruginosa]|nr:hypothetical protein [Pseudomonas aeruginosa]
MSSTQHQLIEQCATRLRGIVEALDNIHDTSPHRWSTDLDDVHSSAESLLALIKDQAPTQAAQGLAGAALAQPSLASVCATPAGENCPGDGVKSCKKCPEADRPEAVGYLATAEHPKHGQPHKAFNYFKDQHDAQVAHWRERGCEVSEDELMTVTQHARIVGALRADRDSWAEQAEQRLADWDEMRKERDAALARVAEMEAKLSELEKQEPLLHINPLVVDELLGRAKRSPGGLTWSKGRCGSWTLPLYAAPVAQAQQLNDLDKQCRDDVARALGLRPNQERGFAWSYLLASIKSCVKASGDSAQAQHSAGYAEARQCVNCRHIGINDAADYAACHDCRWTGPEPDEDKCPGCAGENCMAAACPECGGRYELVAEAKISTPAAQAGQMPQAWLDVQAERRRQIEAEGWTPEHDDGHACDEIAAFACYYAMPPAVRDWDASSTGYGYTLGEAVLPEGWEPKTGDRRRELVKACALALAEIERLDRATA